MIYGQSGTGKSTSLRNFTNDEVAVINVSGKPLPFRSKLTTYDTDNYAKISSALGKIERKSIVIDDATYLMVNEFMRTAKVAGYQKYTDMAVNFNSLVAQASQLANDKIVYFLGHSDLKDDGTEHFKTIGKMLDNYVTVEGKFTIVLKTVVQDGKYYFATHNSGQDTVKSPLGMFESNYVDNDLKAVDAIIREYYGIGG
nr:MAG TPA: AAA domain protein [Caudoviricetes sp.]